MLTIFCIALTVGLYLAALYVYEKLGKPAWVHPIILTAIAVYMMLTILDIELPQYTQSTQILSWLLVPATVALAVPLFNQLANIRRQFLPLMLPIMLGGIVAPVIAVVVLWAGDAPVSLVNSMWTKSITTPLAMDTTESLGGIPSLAAAFVILTGVIAVLATGLIKGFNHDDPNAYSNPTKGLSLGTIGHAIGTAKAAHINEQTLAYATIALCVNGLLTAILLPLFFYLFA